MKIHRTMLPGQPGTKKIVDQYGDELVCVRYRYDEKNKERLTTIELIVDRQKWVLNHKRIPANKIMKLKIDYGERDIAMKVKSLGGQWDSKKRVWKLPYKHIQLLHLEERICK